MSSWWCGNPDGLESELDHADGFHVRNVPSLVLAIAMLMSACSNAETCMWPDRPDCEPVGTTVVVTELQEDDPLCGTTRYYDEIGEAAFAEFFCE